MIQFGTKCEVLGNQRIKRETRKKLLQRTTLLYCLIAQITAVTAAVHRYQPRAVLVLYHRCRTAMQVSAVRERLAFKSSLSFTVFFVMLRHNTSTNPGCLLWYLAILGILRKPKYYFCLKGNLSKCSNAGFQTLRHLSSMQAQLPLHEFKARIFKFYFLYV